MLSLFPFGTALTMQGDLEDRQSVAGRCAPKEKKRKTAVYQKLWPQGFTLLYSSGVGRLC